MAEINKEKIFEGSDLKSRKKNLIFRVLDDSQFSVTEKLTFTDELKSLNDKELKDAIDTIESDYEGFAKGFKSKGSLHLFLEELKKTDQKTNSLSKENSKLISSHEEKIRSIEIKAAEDNMDFFA